MMGKCLYFEWLVPIMDYLSTLKKKECAYEIFFPLVITILVTYFYSPYESSTSALIKLRELLPNVLAILIGFSITAITIIISTDNENINRLKKDPTDGRKLKKNTKNISVYQWVLMMFSYSLIAQVFLLILILFTAFCLKFLINPLYVLLLLCAQVFLSLHILLLLIRSITNFYFIFFKNGNGN